jgi:hypothetical protein
MQECKQICFFFHERFSLLNWHKTTYIYIATYNVIKVNKKKLLHFYMLMNFYSIKKYLF